MTNSGKLFNVVWIFLHQPIKAFRSVLFSRNMATGEPGGVFTLVNELLNQSNYNDHDVIFCMLGNVRRCRQSRHSQSFFQTV